MKMLKLGALDDVNGRPMEVPVKSIAVQYLSMFLTTEPLQAIKAVTLGQRINGCQEDEIELTDDEAKLLASSMQAKPIYPAIVTGQMWKMLEEGG